MAYHHGDLAVALVDAGLELSREGGLEALTIREVTRRVGVSPNAAYRHYPNLAALREAVSDAILARLAGAMTSGEAGDGAARLRTVGLTYIDFALAEPGWFAVAFFGSRPITPEVAAQAPAFRALAAALDAMVEEGALAPSARADAAWSCWATVHGFAELALHGPLAAVPAEEQRRLAAAAVDAVIAGVRA